MYNHKEYRFHMRFTGKYHYQTLYYLLYNIIVNMLQLYSVTNLTNIEILWNHL